jgi:hypothetical protein
VIERRPGDDRASLSRLIRLAWWHSSDNGLQWLWRPCCWLLGYHRPHHCDVYFELCWFCGKHLWSRKTEGGPNPFIAPDRGGYIDRAPATWRRLLDAGA